jgi:DNA polymerase-3 subunit gamma/tau
VSSIPQHQAIYRRWRAQTFGQIVGQEAVVETLRNAARTSRVSHGVLFVGPRGTGKTSLARILAKAINCTNLVDGEPCDACPSCVAIREGRTLDVYEIDAASHRGIDAIREIRERIQYPPGELTHKVYILDEAHQITKDAWGALLKTLEEPPDFVNFMFASTEPAGFPAAILSRLQRFDLRRLTVPEIAGKMRMILEADGRTAEPEAIDLIARLAAGGMRDAESMLDQLLATDAEALTADRVREVLGLVEEETVDAFLRALVSGEPMAGIEILDGLEERGRDIRAFSEQAMERLRMALVASLGRGSPGGLAAAGPATLAAAARRLAAIDPTHPGPGGLRLQLELALLAPVEAAASAMPPFPAAARPVVTERPASSAAPQPRPAPEPSAPSEPPHPAGQSDGHSVEPAAPDTEPRDSRAESHAPSVPQRQPSGQQAPRPVSAAAPAPTAARTPAPATAPTAAAAAPERPSTAAAPIRPSPAAQARPTAPGPRVHNGPTMELLLERWAEIVEVISKSPAVKPLIVACRPVGVDGAVVTLGFPEAQSFFKDVAERRRANLEDGVGRVLGMPVTVRCVAANVEVSPMPADPDSSRLLTEFRRIYGDDVVDVSDVD